MADFVNLGLLNAHALPVGPDEPHLQPGTHLRLSHHPLLGLPVAPFVLQRAVVRSRKTVAMRHEAVFTTAEGIESLPVEVRPDRPVTIHLGGPGRTCIWASVSVDPPASPTDNPPVIARPDVVRPDLVRPDRLRDITAPQPLADRLTGRRPGGSLGGGLVVAGRAPKEGLTVEAFVASVVQGPVFAGRRSAAPYALSAPGIVQLVVRGAGTITGIDWIAGEDPQELGWQTVSVLNLPHPGGRRYMAITGALDLCRDRAGAQAPKRRPLQDTTGAPAPLSAPLHGPADEVDRVTALTDPLMADLDALVNDPTSPLEQVVRLTVTDGAGTPLVSDAGDDCAVEYARLPRLFQGLADPGPAALFGYKDCDRAFEKIEDRLVFYRVLGWFRDDPAAGKRDAALGRIIGTVPLAERSREASEVESEVAERAAGWLEQRRQRIERGKLAPARDYMRLSTLAVADRAAPPDPVDPPGTGAGRHVAWLPSAATTPRREVEIPVSGVMVGAILAQGRVQPEPGGPYAALNPQAGHGWRVPLVLGLRMADGTEPPSDTPGRGTLFDRAAGPEAARYLVAQADRFGRWSPFSASLAAAGPRPKPPRPVLRATYAQPPLAEAGLRGGRIEALVALPDADTLAPASVPLSRLRLSARHHPDGAAGPETILPPIEVPVTAAITVAPVPAGHRAVPVRFDGPVLQPMEVRRLVLTAEWIDTAGQVSAPSEPARLRMTDPRPPAHLPIAETLLYASRPDATGLAWVERSWPAGPAAARYAVYYTDETRLLAHLAETGEAALAASLRANPDRAARAGQYRARQASFPDRLFERLEGAVLDLGGGRAGFRHAVSGASRVLNGYKIVPESAVTGARPAISGADMVLYGVPNSDPPPRPMLGVRQVAPEGAEPALVVEVTVRLPKGLTPGQTCRIYRTRSGTADPLRSPVVALLAFGPADPATGEQVAVFRDIGTAQIATGARLAAFARYAWFADAQGAPESGSAVAGRWGRVSDPVTLAVVPGAPPEAPAVAGFGGTPVPEGLRDATLNLTHGETLSPPAMGAYRLRLERALPGAAMLTVFEGEIAGMPLTIGAGDPAGFVTPIGTRFRATLSDPLGRAAPAVTATLT